MARLTFKPGKAVSELFQRAASFVSAIVKIIGSALKNEPYVPTVVELPKAGRMHNNRKETAFRRKRKSRYFF